MEQKMIYMNLKNDKLYFYNIHIEKNKDEYILISQYGKIGNKGTTLIVYRGKDYSICKTEFWQRVNEKKLEHYKSLNEVKPQIDKLFDIKESACDICGKSMDNEIYDKINSYLRKESGVDNDKNSIAYKKVLCIDCQKKYGIYKGKNK